MFKYSIKTKLILLIIIVIIPLIILQVIRINEEFNDKIISDLNAKEQLAEAISISYMNYLEELWIQASMVGSFIKLNPQGSLEEIQTNLLEVKNLQPTLKELLWISPEGIIIACTDSSLAGVAITNGEHYLRIMAGEENVISDLSLNVLDNEPNIVIMTAIKEEDRFLGIVAGLVDIETLSEKLPSSTIIDETRFGLFDRKGMVIYRNDIDMKNITFENRIIPKNSPALRSLNGEIVKEKKSNETFDGKTRMGVSYPIKEIGWSAFVTTSYENYEYQLYKRYITDVFILSLVALISIFATYLLGKKMIEPLISIKSAATKIKKGDYSIRTNIKGNDEIAFAAEAFDSMAESIEKHDQAKSQFFTNISHELKTPLNVILASTQLLEAISMACLDCKTHNTVDHQRKMIKQNAYRLIRMIGNLIDISKFDFGSMRIKLQNLNIVSIVEDITLSIIKYAENKNIEVIFDTDIEEKIVACDPDLIERMILNLISNALKFTDKGGTIKVSVLDKDHSVLISVQDNGIGIPQDKIDLIFERFGQVDNSLSRNKEGSGIGLSLVKALVLAHNGSINVFSEVGKGTEFIIEIPVNRVTETPIQEEMQSHSIVERIAIEFSDIYEIRG